MNAWPPQASYPCGNFSDTSRLKLLKKKGSIGHTFVVRIHTENLDQASFCPFALREVSVLAELALGHLRYLLTDVPPQSNSPPDNVLGGDCAKIVPVVSQSSASIRRHQHPPGRVPTLSSRRLNRKVHSPLNRVSKATMKVVVFHCRTPEDALPLMLHLSCRFTKSD